MKYKFKEPPRPHQLPALKELLRRGGGGLQVPKRYGKTKIAIDFVGAMAVLCNRPLEVLVLCPANVLSVWPVEIERHCAVTWLIGEDGEVGSGLSENHAEHVTWHIVNFESSWKRVNLDPYNPRSMSPMPRDELEGVDIVIIDESHNIGNPTSVSCKMAFLYCRAAQHVVFMTGSMFERKPRYVFGQFKCYDVSVFGTNFGAFKKQIEITDRNNDKIVRGYKNLDWMMDKVKPHVFITDKVPSQPPVHQVISYDMPTAERRLYDEMEEESAIKVDGEYFTAELILTKHLRLMQIIGGWMKTETGKYRRLGKAHRDMFKLHLTDMASQDIKKIVIAARFVPEFHDIATVAHLVGYDVLFLNGGVPKGKPRQRRIDQFQSINRPTVIVCQPQTAAEGINLSAASNMIWYSLPESYVVYDQMCSRIELYAEKRTLGYDYIMPNHSRAVVTYEALKEKQDVARFIVSDPKRVEQLVRLAGVKRKKRK